MLNSYRSSDRSKNKIHINQKFSIQQIEKAYRNLLLLFPLNFVQSIMRTAFLSNSFAYIQTSIPLPSYFLNLQYYAAVQYIMQRSHNYIRAPCFLFLNIIYYYALFAKHILNKFGLLSMLASSITTCIRSVTSQKQLQLCQPMLQRISKKCVEKNKFSKLKIWAKI